jgi:hypothetical protein
MSEELGKIEKPSVDNFKAGRKLYFVPLIFSDPQLPLDISLKYSAYWDQVEIQITNLEEKLGPVKYLFHELVQDSGAEALKSLEQIHSGSLPVLSSRVQKGASFEALEDEDTLTELMDWSRCLSLGLQNQRVYSQIYKSYVDVNNKRNENITKKIDATLKGNESCIVIMGEGHHVKFPEDVQVFYVAPPALDEIKRWAREQQAKEQAAHVHDENCQHDTEDSA